MIFMVVNIMKGKCILIVFTLVLLACQPVVCKEKNELDDTVLNAQRYLVENNIKAALSILENAILKYPKNNVLRLQFAIALYKNKSYEDSLNQLFKLKSMEEDSQILEKIDMYIDRINNIKRTTYDFHFSYEVDDNVFNYPRGGFNGWHFSEPKKDNYINYFFSLENINPIFKNVSFKNNLFIYGREYKDIKEKNYVSFKLKSGLHYADFNIAYSIQPLVEFKDSYQENIFFLGAYVYFSTVFDRNKKFNIHMEKKWDIEHHDNSNLLNFGYLQNISPWSYIYLDFGRSYFVGNNVIGSNDYFRLGWSYDWDIGISTLMSCGFSYRKSNTIDIFKVKPKSYEYEPELVVWYRPLSLYGIVPKIKVSFIKSKSNHPAFDFSKRNISLFITKTF